MKALRDGRRRASLLARDLLIFGETALPSSQMAMRRMEETAVEGDARAVFMGRMYVMEGSTLGGQYIAAHVEQRLDLARGEGNAFFVGYGDQTSTKWREFKTCLAALPDEATDTVIASARNMFALFGEAMRAESGTETRPYGEDGGTSKNAAISGSIKS